MRYKKPTEKIVLKPAVKRNPAARVVNQKAQTMQDGPRRLGTRKARERAALKDQGVN